MGSEVHRVALPAGAEGPYRVFVNGEERREGEEWRVLDGTLVFTTPLRPRPALGLGRTLMLAIGIGVYGDLRGDTLDLQHQAPEGLRVSTLALTPDDPPRADRRR